MSDIEQLFHKNRLLVNADNSYLYKKIYFDFLINSFLYEILYASDEKIFDYMSKMYGKGIIKYSNFKIYLHDNFESIKNKYYLNKAKYEEMEKVNDFVRCFKDSSKDIRDDIFDNLNISSKETFFQVLWKYLIYYINNGIIFLSVAESILFDLLDNFDSYCGLVSENCKNIKSIYDNLNLDDVFSLNEIEENIAIKNHIFKVEDFKNSSVYVVLLLFLLHLDDFKEKIEKLQKSPIKVINDFFSSIKPKNIEILIKRGGYKNNKIYTLSEIGELYDLTRERVRQIEAKIKAYIANNSGDIDYLLIAYFKKLKGNKKYVTTNQFYNLYEKNICYKIFILYECSRGIIRYDAKYQLIYNIKECDIVQLVDETINTLGIVQKYNPDLTNEFILSIFKYHYKLIDGKVYLKKGYSLSNLYMSVIDEFFTDGFRTGNDDDYNKFKSIIKNRYDDLDVPSQHSLEAIISRRGFILIDRGTYLNEKYCALLPKYLIDEILNYISEHNFVYYRSIYEKFKNELNKLGINNHYYLKGCLDKKLPKGMTSNRDYIENGNSNLTPTDELINLMKSFDKEFTLDDLRNHFPGLKDYTLYSVLYNEVDKGLIFISSKEFIYLNKLKINEDTITKLKEFVDSLFEKLNVDILSAKKIYAQLKLQRKDLFAELNLTNGAFELFSLLKVLFPQYFYKRPFISLHASDIDNRYTVIKKYVDGLDSFNKKDVDAFISKMNIGNIYNYLQFMEDISDDFVQINAYTMVKKEKFNISNSELEEINRIINILLDKYKVLDTKNMRDYTLFPKINYSWNKYMLIGILRTYFPEYYEIKNISNTYINVDFEIRRSNYV